MLISVSTSCAPLHQHKDIMSGSSSPDQHLDALLGSLGISKTGTTRWFSLDPEHRGRRIYVGNGLSVGIGMTSSSSMAIVPLAGLDL